MRKQIYTILTSDTTLASLVAGGWWQPHRIIGSNIPRTPFGVITHQADLLIPEADTYTTTGQISVLDLAVYDRARRGTTASVDYSVIDSILERTRTLLHNANITDDDWGVCQCVYAGAGGDRYDEGWECIFRVQSWQIVCYRKGV